MPTGSTRRRRIRTGFDESVQREWGRYTGPAWRVLVRELRERFLSEHLRPGPGWALELGPGPGRFTPRILDSGAQVVAVDLSLPMLRSLGRRVSGHRRAAYLARVRGAGEHLPFREGTFRAAVVYGNILGFAARDGERLLAEIARVLQRGAVLLLDVASPVGAATEFLHVAAERGFLRKILRDPEYYFLDGVLGKEARAHQPYAPERMGYWEFDFYTVAAAERVLREAGFRTVDRMAVGVLSAYRETLTAKAHRDRRVWDNLLRLEELVGRRPGVLETGHGFVVAAVRGGSRPRRRSRA